MVIKQDSNHLGCSSTSTKTRTTTSLHLCFSFFFPFSLDYHFLFPEDMFYVGVAKGEREEEDEGGKSV